MIAVNWVPQIRDTSQHFHDELRTDHTMTIGTLRSVQIAVSIDITPSWCAFA